MTRCRRAGLLPAALSAVAVLLVAVPAHAEPSPEPTQALHQLALVFHAHSSMSTGDLPLEQLVHRASMAGLDGIVVTENYELGVEYGLWPLRGLLRYRVGIPSVQAEGVAGYLDTVRRAQARYPDMVIVPGLEVIPHYYWTGSLWNDNLTLHDTQKNLLLIGLDDTETVAAAFARPSDPLPVRLARLWPLVLLAPAVWLWRQKRVDKVRTKFYQLSRTRHRRLEAIAVLAISGLLLADNLLTACRPFGAYQADPGERSAQRLIDQAQAAGAAAIWSLPEASDFHQYRITRIAEELKERGGAAGLLGGPLGWLPWTITVKTDPYPDALTRTDGYTGFGALYQDDVRIAEPGGAWDALLLAYTKGERTTPSWGVGELAYHQAGAGNKRLSDVQTVVLARERSAKGALEAIKGGAFYARQRMPEWGLVLDDWSIHLGGSRTAPTAEAISGQSLGVARTAPIIITLRVSATGGRSETVKVKVIRSGQLWQEFSAVTPFTRQWEERAAAGGSYYRVEVGSGDQHLLSNPIFVATGG